MARKIGDGDSKASKKEAEDEARSNLTKDTFLASVNEMISMNEACARQNEARKKLRKTIKARGIELGLLDAAIRMSEWSRSEVRENVSTRMQYLKWLGLPTGTQGDLFASLSDDEVQKQEWDAAGYTAALTGKPNKPPEECPPAFHQDFMRGFNRAADEDFEAAAPDAEAEKKPDDLDRLKAEQAEEKKKAKPKAKKGDAEKPADATLQ